MTRVIGHENISPRVLKTSRRAAIWYAILAVYPDAQQRADEDILSYWVESTPPGGSNRQTRSRLVGLGWYNQRWSYVVLSRVAFDLGSHFELVWQGDTVSVVPAVLGGYGRKRSAEELAAAMEAERFIRESEEAAFKQLTTKLRQQTRADQETAERIARAERELARQERLSDQRDGQLRLERRQRETRERQERQQRQEARERERRDGEQRRLNRQREARERAERQQREAEAVRLRKAARERDRLANVARAAAKALEQKKARHRRRQETKARQELLAMQKRRAKYEERQEKLRQIDEAADRRVTHREWARREVLAIKQQLIEDRLAKKLEDERAAARAERLKALEGAAYTDCRTRDFEEILYTDWEVSHYRADLHLMSLESYNGDGCRRVYYDDLDIDDTEPFWNKVRRHRSWVTGSRPRYAGQGQRLRHTPPVRLTP